MKNNREHYVSELMHTLETRYNRARGNYQRSEEHTSELQSR